MFTCLHVYICDEFGSFVPLESSIIPLESSIIPLESSIPCVVVVVAAGCTTFISVLIVSGNSSAVKNRYAKYANNNPNTTATPYLIREYNNTRCVSFASTSN